MNAGERGGIQCLLGRHDRAGGTLLPYGLNPTRAGGTLLPSVLRHHGHSAVAGASPCPTVDMEADIGGA